MTDPTHDELVGLLDKRRFQCPPSFGTPDGDGRWWNAFMLSDETIHSGMMVVALWDILEARWSPEFVAYPGEDLREVKR